MPSGTPIRLICFALCGGELEEFRNALGAGAGLEAGEKVVDEVFASAWKAFEGVRARQANTRSN
ncbi:hypothetical protein OOK36_49340 [Streptomyces sp. NBC_00365]|uniref:hypothetical protein n=1 Tax=Streptomyces sp. NBC_00365 TaxID=2975726 RepID=UPI00224FFF40|nr:hypothetical protein [Streptomyces sp. NBC_00365]MCX5096592.1 hypothetical protein [Streptomyces sp. NBC_00365]